MNALDPLEAIEVARLLPVVVLPDVDCAVPLGRLLLEAGLPLIEVTCRTPAAIPAILELRRNCPRLLVGAGTVLTADLARESIDAGAQFLISPAFDEEVLQTARDRVIPLIPGVLTPGEVDRARRQGLRIVKIFPANVMGGATYLRSLASVYPDVRFVPTGGVTLENLAEYLALDAVAACGGTWLAPMNLLSERRFEDIRARISAAVITVSRSRSSNP